jgi:hypothetical protein
MCNNKNRAVPPTSTIGNYIAIEEIHQDKSALVEIAFHARQLKFNFGELPHSQQVHDALLPLGKLLVFLKSK